MAISWNVDDLRKTVAAQMAEANRLDAVIDEDSGKRHVLQELHNERLLNKQWRARAEAAEALVAELQSHQDGWMDRAFAAEAEVERLRAGLLRLQDGMDDRTAEQVQALMDNVEYTEEAD